MRHADDPGGLLIPWQRAEIHQHRAAGVGHVGVVQAAVDAAGEVPDQPGVHVPEDQVAGLGLLAGAVDVVEDPADLRPREIGRQRQPGLGAEAILAAVGRQLVDERVGAGVLPDERVVDRLAGVAVPHQRGLALIGDPQAGDVVGRGVRCLQGLVEHFLGAGPDLLGIVLDPARLRKDLLVLLLGDGDDPAFVIEDHRPGARRALIQRCCVLRHWVPFSPPVSRRRS